MTVGKRVLAGSIAGVGNFISIVAGNLLLVPVFLAYWSKEYYGMWLSLLAAQTFLQAIDTGHQGYVGNEILRAAHTSRTEFGRVFGSGFVVAVGLGVLQVVVVGVIVLSGWLPGFLGVVSSDPHQLVEMGWVLVILVVGRLFSWGIGGLLSKAFAPIGAYARGLWWGVGIRLAQSVAIVTALWLRAELVAVAVCYSVVGCLGTALMMRDARSLLRAAGLWELDFDRKMAWGNLRKSTVMTVNNLIEQSGVSGLVLLVSRGLTLAEVPAFTTYRTLANTAMQATNIMLVPVETDMVRWQVNRRGQDINDAFSVGWFACGGAINLVMVMALPVVPWLYELWVRHQIAFDPSIFSLFVCVVALKNFGAPLAMYLVSNNRLRFQSVTAVLRNGLALVGGVIAVKYFGLKELVLVLVVAEFFAGLVAPLYFARQELRLMGADFDFKALGLALVEQGLIGAMALGCLSRPDDLMIWSTSAAVALAGLLWLRWRALPPGVKRHLVAMMEPLGRWPTKLLD